MSGGSNCAICMFWIMSASLWEFHKLMITQHISFKSLDIQSLLLYKVCSGHRWNETGEILLCPFCKSHHTICTCDATCIQKRQVTLQKAPEASAGRHGARGDRETGQRTLSGDGGRRTFLIKDQSREAAVAFCNLRLQPGIFENYAQFISLQPCNKNLCNM